MGTDGTRNQTTFLDATTFSQHCFEGKNESAISDSRGLAGGYHFYYYSTMTIIKWLPRGTGRGCGTLILSRLLPSSAAELCPPPVPVSRSSHV
jgi:hypothetical protein